MTRVVHLISGLMYGGGQKVALDLIDGFAGSDTIAAELWLLGCRHDVLRDRAAFIAPYKGNYSSPATLIAAARSVRSALARSRMDIVHSHGWDADIIAYLATLGRPEARVVHLHVTPAWILSGRPQHRARRIMSNVMFSGSRVHVLAVAGAVRHHWVRSFPGLAGRTEVVPNAVDPTSFHPGDRPRTREAVVTFGAACRLTPQKGLAVLLRALAGVIERSAAPVVLKIAGEGPERNRLETLARELGVAPNVEFLGHIGDVANFYRGLDVAVLAAVSDEGLPLTILEAMATGLPVVACDTGGAAEAVRDGVDGWIVPAHAPDTLADALVTLANDPETRDKMGQSALSRARSVFSPNAQLGAIASRYAALLEGSPARAGAHRRGA